jgi:hypothetical protein
MDKDQTPSNSEVILDNSYLDGMEIRKVTTMLSPFVKRSALIYFLAAYRYVNVFGNAREVLSSPTHEPQQRKQTKQTPWPLVRKRTIPTERLPLVGEI